MSIHGCGSRPRFGAAASCHCWQKCNTPTTNPRARQVNHVHRNLTTVWHNNATHGRILRIDRLSLDLVPYADREAAPASGGESPPSGVEMSVAQNHPSQSNRAVTPRRRSRSRQLSQLCPPKSIPRPRHRPPLGHHPPKRPLPAATPSARQPAERTWSFNRRLADLASDVMTVATTTLANPRNAASWFRSATTP
jgi:hypothetical protein